jgi:TorA maturation chaperone TorD
LLLENPLDENSKKALSNMVSIINTVGLKILESEYDGIFYDLSSDPVPTTASFYEEERDDGKKRAIMVDYVLQSKYRRDDKKYSDLEDDIGFIFSFMQKLIQDEVNADEKSSFLEREVFRNVLNEFVDEFIENIYMHENSAFYQEVALLLKVFIEFERVYLGIGKPKEKIKSKKEKEVFISDAEAKRRLENKRKKSQDIVECVLEEGGDVEDEV